ncbi:hypothetical protein BKA70DRAFT_1271401 [Coprinopsis sp. MPI-PUGE-AT-0042]|nr:hypothetical protein BKA70DRAFT_1271401 [Coprinopsis sp. MPI-PUGE-AT-0042]
MALFGSRFEKQPSRNELNAADAPLVVAPSTSTHEGQMNPQNQQKFIPGGLRNVGLQQQQQLANLNPQQRQAYMQKMQQHQLQFQQAQQQAQLGMVERPPSSMSISAPQPQGMSMNNMMPPPPPRPTTAMGGPGFSASRPGTSMAHRSPVIEQQQQLQPQMPQLTQQQIQAVHQNITQRMQAQLAQQGLNYRDLAPQQQQQLQGQVQQQMRQYFEQQKLAHMQQFQQQQQQLQQMARPGSGMGIHQSPPPTPQIQGSPQDPTANAGSPTAPGTPTQVPSSPSFLRGAKRKLDGDPSPSPGLMNGSQQGQLNAMQQQAMHQMRQRQTASPRPDGMNMMGMNNNMGGGTVNPMMLDGGFGGGGGMGTVNPSMLQGSQSQPSQQQPRQRQPSMPAGTPLAPSISTSSSTNSVNAGMGGGNVPGTPQRQGSLPPGTPVLSGNPMNNMGNNLMSNAPLGGMGNSMNMGMGNIGMGGNMGMGNMGMNNNMGGNMGNGPMNQMNNLANMNNLAGMNNLGGPMNNNNLGSMNLGMNIGPIAGSSNMPNQMNMPGMNAMNNMGNMGNMGNLASLNMNLGMGNMNANQMNMGGGGAGNQGGGMGMNMGLGMKPGMPQNNSISAGPVRQTSMTPSLPPNAPGMGLDMAGMNMGMGTGADPTALNNSIVAGGMPGTSTGGNISLGGSDVSTNLANMGLNMNMGLGNAGGSTPLSNGPQLGTPSANNISIPPVGGGSLPIQAVGSMSTPPVAASNLPMRGTPSAGVPPTAASSASPAGGLPSLNAGTPSGLQPPTVQHLLPPLPASVNLNPHVTRVTVVPTVDSLAQIPPLSQEEIEDIQKWMAIDKEYEEGPLKTMRQRMGTEMREMYGTSSMGGVVPGMNLHLGTAGMWWEKGFERSLRGVKPIPKAELKKEDEEDKKDGLQLQRQQEQLPKPYLKEWTWSSQSRYRHLPVFPDRYGRVQYVEREQFDVRYPPKTKAPSQPVRGRKGIKREGLRIPRRLPPEDANKPEQLVPIRLEFDVEHHRMRDTLIWNLNDPIVTPEHFAQSLVEDYQLPPSYHGVISKSIHEQLSDYKAHSFLFDGSVSVVVPGDIQGEDGEDVLKVKLVKPEGEQDTLQRGKLDNDGEEWWNAWRRQVGDLREGRRKRKSSRRRIKKEDGDEADVEDGARLNEGKVEEDEALGLPILPGGKMENTPLAMHEIPIDEATMHEEMRILIKLDIIVGSMKLDDQFEWDLENNEVTPEEFADVYAKDLGLTGEFKTAIAHSIREQVQTYQKSLFLVGHLSDGTLVQDDELRQAFLPSLVSGARIPAEVSLYTPTLNYLSDGEIERTEKERDKDLNKRRKRNTRGRRGVALPDREPIRTYRTPAIGFPELDPATMALAAATAAPTSSRRAAAAAASLTIANMVASENNNSNYSPPMMNASLPIHAQPPPPAAVPNAAAAANANKKKDAKGLFKAPSFPVVAPLENDPPIVPPLPQLEYRNKLLNARRAKELEREAKEKEFVDGQHPNYINGVWHCSNCGCPESIAVGRRKGPLGDKSQCGTCGKFWHRHRRPRPVEYNPDPEYHMGTTAKKEAVEASSSKTPNPKKKGGAAAMRAAAIANAGTPSASTPQTPAKLGLLDDDDPMSPVSDASSDTEAPLALQQQQRTKVNGASSSAAPRKVDKEKERESEKPKEKDPDRSQQDKNREKDQDQKIKKESTSSAVPASNPSESGSGSAPTSANAGGLQRVWPPEWLTAAMIQLQNRYPSDKFDVILRKTTTATPEWRIKCLDCPGKLYTPGPGETLNNYEVHLKNRQHRQRVNDRLAGLPPSPMPRPSPAGVANGTPGAVAATPNPAPTSATNDSTGTEPPASAPQDEGSP